MKTKPAHAKPNAEAQRTLSRAENEAFFQLRGSLRSPRLGVQLLRRLYYSAPIILTLSLSAATNDLTSALQRGLFEEEANHNLEAAAQAYQSVSVQFDQDRKLAATAIFRLGEVYRKQGKTNEAVVQYERIVREFSDQETLATLSRQSLAGIGAQSDPTVSLPLTRAARLEQKRLLEEEIKLVEQDLAELRSQRKAGLVPPQTEVRAKEREVLKLLRQVAALDVDAGAATSRTTVGAPVTDEEETEIRRLQRALFKLRWPTKTPEQVRSQIEAARTAQQQKLDAATDQMESLRVSLRVPDNIAVMDADKGLDDPRLVQYRAYFEAKSTRDGVRRFGQILQEKLAAEEIEIDLLRQHGALDD